MTDSPACSSCGSTAPQEELVPYARRFGNSQLVVSRSGDHSLRRYETVYRVVARHCTSCGLIQWYTRKE
ncbi:hypothetical protein [Streptomyces sp. RTd22]|uniref:hypothetical protein n=1 Tax=Streptomyces sp. RTd22 TaxID=1841249 RepID=UPI000AE0D7C4|nr:hypothetical protein [Streptomyces sp. RTd22]